MKEIITKIIIDDDGTIIGTHTVFKEMEGPTVSQYSKLMDKVYQAHYPDSLDMKIQFIRNIEILSNELLKRDGKLYLNYVYQLLGFKPNEDLIHVGWASGIHAKPWSDEYVEFDIIPTKRGIIIDFNVDGNIDSF